MFTGLIEAIGTVRSRRDESGGVSFQIECRFDGDDLRLGESIAVDGVCISVEEFNREKFRFTASSETLDRSILGSKKVGEKVHLERALRLGDRLGGHLVQGHVDGKGEVIRLLSRGSAADLTIGIPEPLRRYIVEKGSLAVQGVSLTVAGIESGKATFALIPTTLQKTYLGQLKPGDRLNLEVDILAKYVESLLPNSGSGIDKNKLQNWGFV